MSNRKLFTTLLIFAVTCIFAAPSLHAQWVDKVTLYLPNRVLDLMDTFTINIGGGPTLHAEMRATRAIEGGGGIFYTFKLMKDYNRQYGYAAQNGAAWYLPGLAAEDIVRQPASSLVQEYLRTTAGFPSPAEEIYQFKTGARDYWELGASLGALLIDIDVAIHPIELADAVLGFFFIDIKDDDLTFENFR